MKPVTVPFFISHRGCPHTCSFCDQQIISGSAGQLPDAGNITDKISRWRATAGARPLEVAFFGGTFTALDHAQQAQLLSPLQPLVAQGIIQGIRISTRPDCLNREQLQWLSGQGVSIIELGVQSLDDRVLAATQRGHTGADSRHALALIRAAGLQAGAQLMPGLPGDTPAISLDSLEQCIDAGAQFLRIYPVAVLAGTQLARQYQAGDYEPPNLEQGIATAKVMLHRALVRKIPVIRIGLQADEGLNDSTILAGCYHPALGELVRGELYYDLAVTLLSGHQVSSIPVTIRCHPAVAGAVRGHGQRNIQRLAEQWGTSITIQPDEHLEKATIIIQYHDHEVTGGLTTHLHSPTITTTR